jgi:hypothetical protein
VAIEKRKYARALPQGNAFAALGRRYTKVGRIKDISLGGLAFEYISESETDRDSSRIDIFIVGDVFHLYNIPCEVVYDVQLPVPIEKYESINISSTKRCGVKFGVLTDDDLAQIKHFLKFYGKSPDS